MTARYYLGIDPGIHGALALYDPTSPLQKTSPLCLEIFDMPILKITVNRKKKSRIDLYELARWLDCRAPTIKKAFIENPHSSQQMGVTSAFNFGFSCGVVQAMVAAHLIPMELLNPATWKKAMKLTADKDSCRLRASQLLPAFCGQWSRVMDDGRAEAALMAYHGAQLT